MRSVPLSLILLLAACGAREVQAPQRAEQQRMTETSTAALWSIQARSRDLLEVARAEAELASRDELVRGAAFLGRRTLGRAVPGRFRRDRQGGEDDNLDCGDFLSIAAAQVEFLGSGGPGFDQHRLDPDGDGLACNWRDVLVRARLARAGRA
jgi:hypothetical protein